MEMKRIGRLGLIALLGGAIAGSVQAQEAQGMSRMMEMNARYSNNPKAARLIMSGSDIYAMQANLDRINAEARQRASIEEIKNGQANANQVQTIETRANGEQWLITKQEVSPGTWKIARTERIISGQTPKQEKDVSFACYNQNDTDNNLTLSDFSEKSDVFAFGRISYHVNKTVNERTSPIKVEYKLWKIAEQADGSESRKIVQRLEREVAPGHWNVQSYKYDRINPGKYVFRFDKDGKPGEEVYIEVVSDAKVAKNK